MIWAGGNLSDYPTDRELSAEVGGEMINLSLSDLMEYTEWERQKRHEWMRSRDDRSSDLR